MLRRPPRLIPLVAAVALVTAAGAAATAQPGAEPRALAPTASLASNGGADAPLPLGPDGGVRAPGHAAPETAPAPAPAPAAPAPAPVEAPVDQPAAGESESVAQPEPESPETRQPEQDTGEQDAATPDAQPRVDPPTQADALEGGDQPLVPVGVLSEPVEAAADTAPLIDLAPTDTAAPALADHAELVAEAAQDEEEEEEEEEGEVVIPIPVDELDPEAEQEGPRTEQVAAPAPGVPAAALPRLAETGRELVSPLGTAVLLLLLGGALRISAGPSASARARA